MRLQRPLVCFAVLATLSGPMYGATSGQLGGRVVDQQDIPLPGVSVVISSSAQIGGEQVTQTGPDGRFLFPSLSAGIFAVRLSLDGFASQELAGIQVRLDRLTEVRVVLPAAQFGEAVDVSAQVSVVDPSQSSLSQTLTAEYLELTSVGAWNRSYWKSLNQAPAISVALSDTNPAAYILGSTPDENTFLIDGLDTTDVMGGVGTYLNFEAIDEISLHLAGYEAEYGRAAGGVVNLVTKSGGNSLEGVVDTRYRTNSFEASGEYYDPERQRSRFSETALALGGPIVRDEAWFFASGLYRDTETTPFQSPTTKAFGIDNALAKLTWQASPAWRLMGKYTGGQLKTRNSNASQFHLPEATSRVEEIDEVMQADASGVLTSRLLWTGQIGRNLRIERVAPMSGETATPYHFNQATSVTSGNFLDLLEEDRSRTVIRSDLAFLKEGWNGDHELKAGVELHEVISDATRCTTGDPTESACARGSRGHWFLDWVDSSGGDLPNLMVVTQAIGPQRVDGELSSAFVQDSWSARPNLTINAGIRWDQIRFANSYGSRIARLEKIQPRFGVAWDVAGNGKNLLRASWGQFMHPGTLELSSWASENLPQELWLACQSAESYFGIDPSHCSSFADANGLRWGTDPWGWDPAGWILDFAWSDAPSEIATGLEPSFNEQLTVGFERELRQGTSLEITYVRKKTLNGIDDTCSGNLPQPSEGAACDHFVIANLPQIHKEYTAWMLGFETRTRESFQLIASYVNGQLEGSLFRTSTAMEDAFDFYPYHYVNRSGYLPTDRRHRVRLGGYWLLPRGFDLGFVGWWSSPWRWSPVDYTVRGMPWGQFFTEPRGSREGFANHQLDLQVRKALELGPTRLHLIAAVLNVLDTEEATSVCVNVDGCGSYETGNARWWQQPRRFEVGARLEF